LAVVGGFAWRAKSQVQSNGTEILLELEAGFQRATTERGWDGYVSYLADNATELENGDPILSGKENIRRALGPYSPDMSLTWTPVKAEMSSSGDLGYTFGTYIFRSKTKAGQLVTNYGKYTTIWRKQKDGSWKVVLDMGNSAPAPGVARPKETIPNEPRKKATP
jgi:ketosteroid isomerase-like protein